MTVQRTRLTRDRVLAAAVAVADREGAEALTVRRLAEDLGVHPTSLYNHLPSKAAILDGVVERLFEEAVLPAAGCSWQEWVRQVASTFRDMARAHPGAFMVLTRRPAETEAAYDFTELGLDAFLRAGFTTERAMLAVRAVSLAVLGLALNECPPMGDWVAPDVDEAYGDHRPLIKEAAALELTDGDAHWELFVAALVAGLRP